MIFLQICASKIKTTQTFLAGSHLAEQGARFVRPVQPPFYFRGREQSSSAESGLSLRMRDELAKGVSAVSAIGRLWRGSYRRTGLQRTLERTQLPVPVADPRAPALHSHTMSTEPTQIADICLVDILQEIVRLVRQLTGAVERTEDLLSAPLLHCFRGSSSFMQEKPLP